MPTISVLTMINYTYPQQEEYRRQFNKTKDFHVKALRLMYGDYRK